MVTAGMLGFVSIRCRARRTAERAGDVQGDSICDEFLFAVVRDVQRNSSTTTSTSPTSRFYSLSCETYSGTTWGARPRVSSLFLFAVVRDVQRNPPDASRAGSSSTRVSIRCRARRTAERSLVLPGLPLAFLFAVVRDVQRNPTPSDTPADPRKRCPFAHPTRRGRQGSRFYRPVTVFPQVRGLHTRRGYRRVYDPPLLTHPGAPLHRQPSPRASMSRRT